MRQNVLYVTFIVMIMSEKMFQVVVGAFVFGYCLGYYLFESFKYKNRAEEIHDFF